TSESVNHLEALSQWASFGRLRVPFYLYVPAASIDTTRRLCADHQIPVAELWTYHAIGDDIRFTMIARNAQAAQPKPAPRLTAPTRRPAQIARKKPAAKPRPRAAAKAPGRGRSTASKGKKAKTVRAQRRK